MSAVSNVIPINRANLTLLGVISQLYKEEQNPFLANGYDILHNYVYERNLTNTHDIAYTVSLRTSQELWKMSEEFITFSEARALVRVAIMNIRHSTGGV